MFTITSNEDRININIDGKDLDIDFKTALKLEKYLQTLPKCDFVTIDLNDVSFSIGIRTATALKHALFQEIGILMAFHKHNAAIKKFEGKETKISLGSKTIEYQTETLLKELNNKGKINL